MSRARIAVSLVLVLSTVCWAAPAAAQSSELVESLAAFSREMGAYIDTVRFDQGDIDAFVAGWPEVSALFEDAAGDSGDDESMEEAAAALREIMTAIDGAATNAEYRAWAAASGVDADDWLHKSMRILMLGQRQSVVQQRSAIDIDAQIAQIEAQRDTYGDEVADEIIASTRAIGAYFDAIEAVGTPTDAEAALLESNWPRLVTVMNTGGGGDDDEWGDDEWSDDEWGEEDEYGEYGADVDVDIALPDDALPFDAMDTSFSDYFYGSSYVVKRPAAETVSFFLASTDRHCRVDDESEMAQGEGTTTIYTLYCLTHPGELADGDDVLAVTIMDASPRMIRELYDRRETGWTAFSIDRWVEGY